MTAIFPAPVDLATGFDTADLHGEVLGDGPNSVHTEDWTEPGTAPAPALDREDIEAYDTEPLILSSAAGSLW